MTLTKYKSCRICLLINYHIQDFLYFVLNTKLYHAFFKICYKTYVTSSNYKMFPLVCNPPLYFEVVNCFICGRRRMAVARYRMVYLVFFFLNLSIGINKGCFGDSITWKCLIQFCLYFPYISMKRRFLCNIIFRKMLLDLLWFMVDLSWKKYSGS